MRKSNIVAASFVVLASAPMLVLAQIDTTNVEASLASMSTAITIVGGAIIAVAAIAVTFKWIKGALFG